MTDQTPRKSTMGPPLRPSRTSEGFIFSKRGIRVVRNVCFSPDGKLLAWVTANRTVEMWYVATGEVRSLDARSRWLRAVCFDPNGRRLATADGDCNVSCGTWTRAERADPTRPHWSAHLFKLQPGRDAPGQRRLGQDDSNLGGAAVGRNVRQLCVFLCIPTGRSQRSAVATALR
jgi:hypothetical protein